MHLYFSAFSVHTSAFPSGGLLSVALSVGLLRVAVSDHRALCSSDFPQRAQTFPLRSSPRPRQLEHTRCNAKLEEKGNRRFRRWRQKAGATLPSLVFSSDPRNLSNLRLLFILFKPLPRQSDRSLGRLPCRPSRPSLRAQAMQPSARPSSCLVPRRRGSVGR